MIKKRFPKIYLALGLGHDGAGTVCVYKYNTTYT